MHRVSVYIFLVLLFLGLSTSSRTSNQEIPYIASEQAISQIVHGAPVTVILVDIFQAGFLIKTYYHKYSVVQPYKQPETMIVRTSSQFWRANQNNLGMALFSRDEKNNDESFIPAPPGMLFIGNPSYGNWVLQNSGEREWIFHHIYKHFYRVLGWGNFRPSLKFYELAKINLSNSQIFYGPENEFGTNGKVTGITLARSESQRSSHEIKIMNHLKKFIGLSH